MSKFFVTVTALLATLVVPAAAPARSCVEQIAAVGAACRVPGGFEVHLADGSTLFTHGGDHPPPPIALGPSAWGAGDVSCVGDESSEPHGLAVYVQPSDLPNRHAEMTSDIQMQIETANAMLRAEAAEFGTDISYRMACTAGRPKVVRVVATATRATITFDAIVNDLKSQGFSDSHQKYWIWLDGPQGLGGFGGFGSIENSSANAPNNSNNFGPSYAVTFGYTHAQGGWFVMMHEAGHNLGAVQNTAFMSSGGWHCNDGQDVMCYADGGSKSNYNPGVCTVLHFDCRHDDYFNPRPPSGSYLSRSWNLAAPIDRFVAGCAYRAGRVRAASTIMVDITGCDDRPYSAAGFVPAHDTAVGPVTLTSDRTVLLDVDVCFYAGVNLLSCAQTLNQPERGEVPAGATLAEVTAGRTGPVSDVVFSVV